MKRFFKVTLPNGKTFVVASKDYYGLFDFIKDARDKDHTYITPLSLFDFVKYMLCC